MATRNELATDRKATMAEVLTYWLGADYLVRHNTDIDAYFRDADWRGGLWFRGVDPDRAPESQLDATTCTRAQRLVEMQQLTDAYIARRFGPLLDDSDDEKSSILSPLDQSIAKVILWDQLSRNAFRGTARAFVYDDSAQALAHRLLASHREALLTTHWQGGLFAAIVLLHSEEASVVLQGLEMIQDMQQRATSANEKLASRLTPIHKQFLSHAATLRRFGRYPSRNAALSRANTPEEEVYLAQPAKALPTWARSQLQVATPTKVDPQKQPHDGSSQSTSSSIKSQPRLQRPLRILVLHGSPANLSKFKTKVKDQLGRLSSTTLPITFEFIKAPHLYRHLAMKESKYEYQTDGTAAGLAGLPDNRCWWYMSETDGTYVGLDHSLQTVQDWMHRTGPYDGLLGFSQGATLACIFAALQVEGRLAAWAHVKFVISISGFYCRDPRPEYASLHMRPPDSKDEAWIHTPETIQPRRDPIRGLPSFHTWGQQDQLIDGWRSERLAQAFADDAARVVEPHPGAHLTRAVEFWPMASMRKWLASLQLEPAATSIPESVLQATGPLPGFAEKFFALKRQTSTITQPQGKVVRPIGLCYQHEIMADSFWKGAVFIEEISYRAVQEFIDRLQTKLDPERWGLKKFVDDVMIVAWCLYPFEHVRQKRYAAFINGQPYYWAVRHLFDGTNEDGRAHILNFHLPWIAQYANSWDALARIDLLFTTGTSLREDNPPPRNVMDPSVHCEAMHCRIAQVFAEQLADDFNLVRAARAGDALAGDSAAQRVELYQTSGLPSKCAEATPRKRGAVHRKTKLDVAIADALTKTSQEAEEAYPCGSALNRYTYVVKELKSFLEEYSSSVAELAASSKHPATHYLYGYISDAQWEALKNEPLSQAVLYPTPEPVDIASPEQMAPLHDFLRKGPASLPDAEVTFEKGTLLNDGRLDLCKQVIGPIGINPLMKTLAQDEHGLVQHLLLGNNIAGDDLGRAVGDFVKSGKSKLTTWYIAGNRLTKAGIQPVCDALMNDHQVRQLWLKRNPLLPTGAESIASLLRTNSYLQVLDLTNTGILDEGTCAVMKAMRSNPNGTIQYLYLDTNGISQEGAAAVRDYFLAAPSNSLQGLSIGCNRIGDEGTLELVKGLKAYGTLKRLTLDSCGIGSEGASYLADFLSQSHTELRYLSLGYMKSTYAVGEIPNRISTAGAAELARALQVNTTLEVLDISSNSVASGGFVAIETALSANPSSALRRLLSRQPGMPLNELIQEKIALFLTKNETKYRVACNETGEDDYCEPKHLQEILSVYRIGDTYNPRQ